MQKISLDSCKKGNTLGWVWKDLDGFDWIWADLVGFGWIWAQIRVDLFGFSLIVEGFGRIYVNLSGFSRIQVHLAGFSCIQPVLEGFEGFSLGDMVWYAIVCYTRKSHMVWQIWYGK